MVASTGEGRDAAPEKQTGGIAATFALYGRAVTSAWAKQQGLGMSRRAAHRDTAADSTDGRLSSDELSIVLSALWIWRGQLGRVGTEQPIPGLAAAEARKNVDEIARKLGGDPDAYFFGLDLSQQSFGQPCH